MVIDEDSPEVELTDENAGGGIVAALMNER